MATFLSDSMTDTDGVLLENHTGEVGATWTEHPASAGTFEIASNRVRRSSSATALYYASGTPASAEYDVEGVVFFSEDVSESAGVAGRMDTTNETLYLVHGNAAINRYTLLRALSASYTSLGIYGGDVIGAGESRTIKLELRDAAKKVYVGGVERISSADDSITAAGRAGVRSVARDGDTALIDNITATDAAAGVTVEPADVAHGHTVESPSLTQSHVLAPDDVAHGQAVESPALTQANVLAPADVAHTHPVESPSLTVAGVLVPLDVLHAHLVGGVSLTQSHQIQPDDVLHAHTVGSTTAGVPSLYTSPITAIITIKPASDIVLVGSILPD